MGQPVRKIIQETHPEANVKNTRTLLVDGGNLLKIAMRDDKVNSEGIHYGGVFQFLLQLKILFQKTQFDYVYVFFDDEDSGILRYELYNEYKANRDKHYEEHSQLSDYGEAVEAKLNFWKNKYANKKPKKVISQDKIDRKRLDDENFARERSILLDMFGELYIRWIMDSKTEGDDLISYYVHHKNPEDLVFIMSCDEDLTQLISDTVCVYNHRMKTFLSTKNFKEKKGMPIENVVIKKIMCGDTSDNIGNIKGLSEEKLFEMMPEMKERPVTIEEIKQRASDLIDERVKQKKKPLQVHENIVNGISNKHYDGDFYEINRKIIDLGMPLLTKEAEEELKSMMYEVQDPEGRSFENLYNIIIQNGIDELKDTNRFASFFNEFKTLCDKEKNRYEKQK